MSYQHHCVPPRTYLPVAWNIESLSSCLCWLPTWRTATRLPGRIWSGRFGCNPGWLGTTSVKCTDLTRGDTTLALGGLLRRAICLKLPGIHHRTCSQVCTSIANYSLCTLPLSCHGLLYTLLCESLLWRAQGFSAGCKREISTGISSPGTFSLWNSCLHVSQSGLPLLFKLTSKILTLQKFCMCEIMHELQNKRNQANKTEGGRSITLLCRKINGILHCH